MKIYIDNDYKCHTSPGEGLTEVETDAFNGKCSKVIEGYRFIPAGERLILPDGSFFRGEMVAPWQPYEVLKELQALYEEEQANQADMAAALEILGVNE